MTILDTPFLTNLNLTNCTSLQSLNTSPDDFSTTSIVNLDLSTCSSLQSLTVRGAPLTSLDLSNNTNLTGLALPDNFSLTNLNISNTQLNFIPSALSSDFQDTPLTFIIAQNCSNLVNVTINNNTNPQLENLDVQQSTNLNSLNVSNGIVTTLNVLNCNNLSSLVASNNMISSLDVSSCPSLGVLAVSNNQLVTMDLSNNSNLTDLDIANNLLVNLFVKNGSQEIINNFSGNPNLSYICADEVDFLDINLLLDNLGYSTVLNSYCTFIPGGSFNTIEGEVRADLNNNDCDINDSLLSNFNFTISNNNNNTSSSLFSDSSGQYRIYVGGGIYTITPQLENPDYFTIALLIFQQTPILLSKISV